MKGATKPELEFSPEERIEYTKAYRSARQTKKGSNKSLNGGKFANDQGHAAVKAYRTRVDKLKDYVDNDRDISVLEED